MLKNTYVWGHVYHTEVSVDYEVVLVESGIGKVMSAMSVAVLVNDFKVTAVELLIQDQLER